MKYIILIIFSSILLFSCTKHTGDQELPEATITFSEPVMNQSYNRADSIAIKATAIAPVVMHGYDLAIKKANDTTTYFFTHVHDHNDTLQVDKKWKNTITGVNAFDVLITVYLDHDGHTATKKIGFTTY